jgi:heat shock protein HslJ
MSRFPNTIALAVFVAITSYGCSTGNPAGPTQPLSALLGGSWTLVAQQPAGGVESAPPAGSTFSFEIVDGRAAVRADCNRCNGLASIDGDSVTFGPALACTRAYCTTSAPFDTVFVQLLADRNRASIDGSTLTLRSERGMLRFRR